MFIGYQRLSNYFLLFAIIISICGCFATKSISINSKSFKGTVNGDVNFKYFLEKDTNNVLRLRVYDITGIKLGDFLLEQDSLKIKYIIDNSYKALVLEFFRKNNPKFCFYDLIDEMYYGNLFISNKGNYACFLKEVIDSSRNTIKVSIMTRKYEKFANIEGSGFANILSCKIPNLVLLNMVNGSNYKISIAKK